MKKMLLIMLTVLLASVFITNFGPQYVMAAEYGGIAVVASSKGPLAFGYPAKIRGYDQELAAPALEFLVNATLKGTVEPHLAESWDISPDGKTFTFKLQKGVKFHDGTDFNAQAVKYNLDVWLKKEGAVLSKLKSVEVVDDHTVRLNFSQYDALILFDLSVECYMASPTAIEKNGEKWAETHPVGTGPFKLKKYERNAYLKYERNENYWKKGLPYLDELEFRLIKDPMTQVAALKTGEIDVIYDMLNQHASLLEKEGYDVERWNHNCISIYGDSTNPDSPWSKKKVREAAEYAINKEAIMKDLGYGYPVSLYQYVSKEHPFYNLNLKPRMYDPEKAKKLLAEAGYPNGFKTTIIHYAPHWPESWVAIQADLAKVGIDAKINKFDKPKWYAIIYGDSPLKDAVTHGNYAAMGNIIYGLKGHHASDSGQFQEIVRPEGFDETLGKLLVERDPGKQKEWILQATKILYDNVSFIPLNVEARLAVLNKSVHGINYTTYAHPNTFQYLEAWKSKK